jgi:hypothetical protein
MKRGAPGSSPPARASSYAGSRVSADVKEHTARLAVALQAQGVAVETIMKALADTAYTPKRRTLMRHMAAIKDGNAPLSAEKGSGRPPTLTPELWAIVFGWVLCQQKPVNLVTVQRWIKANFDEDVSSGTLSRHKDTMGLSFQLVGRRGMTPGISRDEYVIGYFEFVQRLRLAQFFDFDPNRIICIDFVTNSQRREYEKTLSIIGGKQKKISRAAPLYTNSYIVGVSLGGGLDILSLMFIYDPAFDPNGPRRNEVQSWCDANKIRRDQIYYEKSASKYCKESRDQVVEFEKRNRAVLTGARVLHDQGGSFKLDGEFILAERSEAVIVFPAEQHGELSVLDNKLNAVAKHKWHQERHNADFAWDAFLLFVELHRVGQDSISSWWTFNFLLDVPVLTLTAVENRLKESNGRRPIRQDLADQYDQQYSIWLQDHDEVELVYEGDEEEDALDGAYWK